MLRCTIYYRFRSIGVSIDWRRPDTTVDTNPVCRKIELGSLRGGLCDLFGTSCERTLRLGLAKTGLFARNTGGSTAKFRRLPVIGTPFSVVAVSKG